MQIDPDIAAALKAIAADVERLRVAKVRARHAKQAEQRFETEMELLTDEVERVIPKDNPLFPIVLLLAVARKIERTQVEPKFKPFADFPNGW